jgi:predicted transcriptional regulator YdeE
MEIHTFDQDITVLIVTATSFPGGILPAHEQLHRLIPYSENRRYFGISRPEEPEGPIVYHAGAEQLHPGEAEQFGLETIVLKKGDYASATIEHYMDNPGSIGRTFEELLQEPNLDPQGYCVEWYVSDEEVKCMVRLRD